jgi:hypothetical protein
MSAIPKLSSLLSSHQQHQQQQQQQQQHKRKKQSHHKRKKKRISYITRRNKQRRFVAQHLADEMAKRNSAAAMKMENNRRRQLYSKNHSNNNNNNRKSILGIFFRKNKNDLLQDANQQYYYDNDDYISQFFPEAKRDNDPSVVLLGAGEGGKATIYKQIAHMYNKEFEKNESRASWISVIHHNVIMSMYSIVSYVRRSFVLPYDIQYTLDMDQYGNDVQLKEYVQSISKQTYYNFQHFARFDDYEARLDCMLTPDLIEAIEQLWTHEPLIKYIYHYHRHERYQLNDSAEFWFNNLQRISDVEYVPTLEDLLKMRVKTTGVLEQRAHEAQYGANLNLILMGSQRNERKKWLSIIRDRRLCAVVFVIALSEFSQTLYENDTTNRLEESLCVFSEMINSHSLQDVPIYLFLNKTDVFSEKMQDEKLCDLSRVFPDLPRTLRKEYIQDKGVYLLPHYFDNCCFVHWEETNLYNTATTATEDIFSIGSPRSTSNSSRCSWNSTTLPFSSPNSPVSAALASPRSPPSLISPRSSISNISTATTSTTVYSDRVSLKTTLIRTRKPSYELLEQWKPLSSDRKTSLFQSRTDDGKAPYRIVDLSFDEMGYVCSFLDVRELCRLAQVNGYTYLTSSQDFIWRNLYYNKLLRAKPALSENIDNITFDEQMIRQIYEDELCEDYTCSVSKIGMWKFFVKYTSQNFYQRNITYILEELLTSTDRRDIKVFLTDATDPNGMYSILKDIVPEIAQQEANNNQQQRQQQEQQEKQQQDSKKHKVTNLISKIKNLFKR